MTHRQIIARLKALANPQNVAGMARFGINPKGTLGISIVDLRRLAREVGRGHHLAQKLWTSGFHEARILASFVADPAQITEAQADQWVGDFDSWDICDQVTGLLEKTPFAHKKIRQWATDEREFVKRAAFAMIAGLAVHDKTAPNAQFNQFLQLVRRAATDERNLVKKAVNWALRSIGKRNKQLNRRAIALARAVARLDSPVARWIAFDALRELESAAVRARLRRI